jgi:DNA-binding NarL/FixJ family response regulator
MRSQDTRDVADRTKHLRHLERAYQTAAAKAEAKRQERNAAVAEALTAGMTHAEIAKATGMSRGRVGQLR